VTKRNRQRSIHPVCMPLAQQQQRRCLGIWLSKEASATGASVGTITSSVSQRSSMI